VRGAIQDVDVAGVGVVASDKFEVRLDRAPIVVRISSPTLKREIPSSSDELLA
jgi:hypothetical protein